MGDGTRDLATHLKLLPAHRIVLALILVLAEIGKVSDLRQIEAPQVVHGAKAYIIASEDVQPENEKGQQHQSILTCYGR